MVSIRDEGGLLRHQHHVRQALDDSVQHGQQIERYGRRWRMGRYQQLDAQGLMLGDDDTRVPRFLFGRIGFEQAGEVSEIWDEDVNDFREVVPRQGKTSPFVLDFEKFEIAYQLRGSTIKPQTFTGNFQALINEGATSYRWQVRHRVSQIPWETWIQRVSRVTELSLRLDRPNPDYQGRDFVESVVEDTRAASARLKLKAAQGELEGLDLEDRIIQEGIEHAQEYGDYWAKAEVPESDDETPPTWSLGVQGAPVTHEVSQIPSGQDVPYEHLRDEVVNRPADPDDEEASDR